jgi:tetratricopeptide (TPR) repeat protein
MKKILAVLIIVGFFGALLYSYLSDESVTYYKKAEQLYEEGKYFEAHETVKQALDKNTFNRKALILKAKLYDIVLGEESYSEAKKLYEESINYAMQGDYERASYALKRSVELADKVPSTAPAKEKADELLKKIDRDADFVLSKAPEILFKKAKNFYEQGNYRRAFEDLNRLPSLSPEGSSLKSSAAYNIGLEGYSEITRNPDVPKEVIYDAIYWFEQVESGHQNYSDAAEKLTALREMLD